MLSGGVCSGLSFSTNCFRRIEIHDSNYTQSSKLPSKQNKTKHLRHLPLIKATMHACTNHSSLTLFNHAKRSFSYKNPCRRLCGFLQTVKSSLSLSLSLSLLFFSLCSHPHISSTITMLMCFTCTENENSLTG